MPVASILVPMIATLVARASASSMECVVSRMARLAEISLSARQRMRLAPASWPVEGSSRRRTRGLPFLFVNTCFGIQMLGLARTYQGEQ